MSRKRIILPLFLIFVTGCARSFPNNALFDLLLFNTSGGSTPTPLIPYSVTLSVSSLFTTEAGPPAQTFTAVLTTAPTADVVIPVSSSTVTEGKVSPDGATWGPFSLTFTTANWNVPQTVNVVGVPDGVADTSLYTTYNVVLGAITSADPNYSGYDPTDLLVMNYDIDSGAAPGVSVVPTSGLVTSESGNSDHFAVVLNTRPAADVVIDLASSNTSEVTVSPATLTFTSTNWSTPQPVTVTGVDELLIPSKDGGKVVTITPTVNTAATLDSLYKGPPGVPAPATVSVTNADNDTAGITTGVSSLFTSENGTVQTFQIVLNTQPAAGASVAFTLTSLDTTEAQVSLDNIAYAASKAVSIPNASWNTPVTVYIKGIDDTIVGDEITFNLSFSAVTSADTNYSTFVIPSITVTNFDNDSGGVPGVHVIPTTAVTSEAGTTAQIAYVLKSKVALGKTVTITLSGVAAEGTLSPATLNFNDASWSTPQSVTITGVNDNIVDANQIYSLTGTLTSTDANYAGVPVPSVSITNNAITPGVSVTPVSGLSVSESGTTALFYVSLTSPPAGVNTVDITATSPLTGEILVSKDNIAYAATTTLSFNSANWSTPKAVYLKGQDEQIADGNQTVAISLAIAASTTDPDYPLAMAITSVSAINVDNDVAGVTVISSTNFITSESGLSYTFKVVLNSNPGATVTVPVTLGGDPGEGVLSAVPAPIPLNFDSTNWSTPVVVTVTGQDDLLIDGNMAYSVTIGLASAPVGNPYNNLAASIPLLNGTNLDNEAPIGFSVVSQTIVLTEGDPGVFYVVLDAAPTNTVVLTVTNNSPAQIPITSPFAAASGNLTFDSTNWNIPKAVNFDTENYAYDGVGLGNYSLTVSLNGALTTDAAYNGAGLPAKTVSVSLSHLDKRLFLMRNSAGAGIGQSGKLDTLFAPTNTFPGTGIDEADTICTMVVNNPLGAGAVKAVIVDGTARIACTSANCITGGVTEHVDWVLSPKTMYYIQHMTAAGPVYGFFPSFRTNANGIFIFASNSLLNPWHESSIYGLWTGLMPDWTSHANNCNKWTKDANPGLPSGGLGSVNGRFENSISTSDPIYSTTCDAIYGILCAEQ